MFRHPNTLGTNPVLRSEVSKLIQRYGSVHLAAAIAHTFREFDDPPKIFPDVFKMTADQYENVAVILQVRGVHTDID